MSLDPEINEQLAARANTERIPKSRLVEQIVAEHFERLKSVEVAPDIVEKLASLSQKRRISKSRLAEIILSEYFEQAIEKADRGAVDGAARAGPP